MDNPTELFPQRTPSSLALIKEGQFVAYFDLELQPHIAVVHGPCSFHPSLKTWVLRCQDTGSPLLIRLNKNLDWIEIEDSEKN